MGIVTVAFTPIVYFYAFLAAGAVLLFGYFLLLAVVGGGAIALEKAGIVGDLRRPPTEAEKINCTLAGVVLAIGLVACSAWAFFAVLNRAGV